MKARYYVHCFDGFDPLDQYRLLRVGHLLGEEDSVRYFFNSYLFGAITSDFPPPNSIRHIDDVLVRVAEVESTDLSEYQYEGDGFVHNISLQRVRFEHSIFGECPEWPIWCCTLAQYKAALQGYRRFLDMPKSIDSELIIELPEGEPENC